MTILTITNEQYGQDPIKINFLEKKAEIKKAESRAKPSLSRKG